MAAVSLGQLAKTTQARVAEKMRTAEKSYPVTVLDKKIIVFPRVFCPATDTILLIQSARIEETDRVLEPFSGSGAVSVFLANRASSVVATDINPEAVKNINENIRLHGLETKMRVVQADIFPDEKTRFDVIVANPPYTDNEAHDDVEKAFWDKNHQTVRAFFREAKKHLAPDGKIYCSWSNFADFDFFEKMVKANRYSIQPISETSKEWKTYRVYEIKPR